MMIGEVIGALDDLAAVGIAGSNLQVLRASAAAVTARLDCQIAAAWAATCDAKPNGNAHINTMAIREYRIASLPF